MLFLNAKNCWQQIHKPTIVQHNDRDLSKKSGFPFPSGFRDFEKTNQTEQTVNRKKSGFRTAPNRNSAKQGPLVQVHSTQNEDLIGLQL